MRRGGNTPRRAEPRDVDGIWRLIDSYARGRLLLARDRMDIRAHLANFLVIEAGGEVGGCVAVRDFGNRLHEIRSLAVTPAHQGEGLGKSLVEAALSNLKTNRPARVFALTKVVGFFITLGFHVVEKSVFPEKIWSDCDQCPNKEYCDEEAVLLEMP